MQSPCICKLNQTSQCTSCNTTYSINLTVPAQSKCLCISCPCQTISHALRHALKDSPPWVFIPLTMLPLSKGVKCLVLNYHKQFLHKAAFNEDCLSPRKLNRGSVKMLALMKVSKQDACGSLGNSFVYAIWCWNDRINRLKG